VEAATRAYAQSGSPNERSFAEEAFSACPAVDDAVDDADDDREKELAQRGVRAAAAAATAAASAPSPSRSSDNRLLTGRKKGRDPFSGDADKPRVSPARTPPDRPRKRKGAPGARANMYVRRVGDTLYAMGLSRKVKTANPEGLSIIDGESFPDHAWIIYEKQVEATREGGREDVAFEVDDYDEDDLEGGGEWKVHRLLASVELKTQKTSGKPFDMKNSSSEETEEGTSGVDPTGSVTENGPLAQELSYVVGHALPGMVGLGLDLPTTVPFAVVAGKCSGSTQLDAIRWVHGNVATPDECGGGFYYTVDAFETFRRGNSGRSALAAYLDVVWWGLSAGEKWLANRNHEVLGPKPLCGRIVKFGAVPLNEVSLMYSPLNIVDQGQASQGEIFGGNVNLTQLRSSVPDGDNVTWCRVAPGAELSQSAGRSHALSKSEASDPFEAGPQAERRTLLSSRLGESSCPAGPAAASSRTTTTARWEKGSSFTASSSEPADGRPPAGCTQPVLVKVVSRACFGKLVGREGLLWSHADSVAFRGLLGLLSPSLHAVYTVSDEEGTDRGLVQLMPDLSGTYEPLCPHRYLGDADQKKRMWAAFTTLVKGTLIPLAEAKVVHLDLRPGYNRTANILYNSAAGEMRVIDLDSLVLFGKWTDPVKHKRYLNKAAHPSLPTLRTALEFLFLQVVVIADAWSRKIVDGQADASEIAASNAIVKAWAAPGAPRAACDGAFLLERLEDIGAGLGVPRGGAGPDPRRGPGSGPA
jgi:hypothetical protein